MEYDKTSIPEVYVTARELPAESMAVWADALRSIVPADAEIARVLDLGCGTARFVGLLANTFDADVIGLDPSVRMLAERDIREPRAHFAAAAAEALPLGAGTIDVVFLSMVYHHLVSVAATLAEARRVLRPTGYMIVRNPARETVADFEYMHFFPDAMAIDLARMPSRAAIRDAFSGAGFIPIDHRVVQHRFAQDYADYYRKVSLRGLSSLQLISDEAFARGLEDFERRCRETWRHGPIYEPVELFLFQRRAG